ncbi:FadR/GntR family transcriptional regulator [Isoptericola halotolerans]|uniref:FadR/GntR family transcriptional regulator n=1 Tax=Isoptericola halotolerans TaxID=300560 RepID=UPI00388E64F1
MTEPSPAAAESELFGPLFAAKNQPAPMLGVAVVDALVDSIVAGRLQPGTLLPPESSLIESFGVSRTVIRESVKRLEEKGLVTIARGRGTSVNPTSSWNILDQVILSSLIKHDDTLGVLDELSVVRAQLESVMAGEAAMRRTAPQLSELEGHLLEMRSSLDDETAFRAADAAFHQTMMAQSGNRLAESIARILFRRALSSARYHGIDPSENLHVTLAEHEKIFAAVAGGDENEASETMKRHVLDAWRRRRIPHRGEQPSPRRPD